MKWYKTNSRQTEKSRIQPLTKNKNKNLKRLYKKPEEEKDQNVKNIQVTQKARKGERKKKKKSEGKQKASARRSTQANTSSNYIRGKGRDHHIGFVQKRSNYMLSIKDVFLKSQKNESKRRGKEKRYATQTTNIRKSQRGYFNTRQHRLTEKKYCQ